MITDNRYVLPFLANTWLEPIFISRRKNRIKKKYKCVAVYNNHTNSIRRDIVEYLYDFCDVIIINGEKLKIPEEYIDYDGTWDYLNIMDSSEFVIAPPGATYDTCRYTEALFCNCIPLTLYNPDIVQMIPHPEQYTWTLDSIKNCKLPEFKEDILVELQKNINPNFLMESISNIINKHLS